MSFIHVKDLIEYLKAYPSDFIYHHLDDIQTLITDAQSIEQDQNEINQRIQNLKEVQLAKFINQAKTELTATQLQQIPTFDQPDKTSKATSKLPENVKFVKRLLIGANIGDHYYNEKYLRKLPYELHTGDLVEEFDYYPTSNGGHIRLYEQHGDAEHDHIQIYHQVILEHDNQLNHNVIRQYADGSRIKHHELPLTITLPDDALPYGCEVGDIVDYAFYLDDQHPFDKSFYRGSIRWTYPTQVENLEPTISAKIKNNKTTNIDTPTTDNHDSSTTLLDMDITNHHIGIATAYQNAQKVVDHLNQKYHTDATWINTDTVTHPTDQQYLQTLDKYDEIVITLDYIRHEYTQPVINYLNKTNHPYAIAETTKLTSIEQALYRTNHHLPATQQANICYTTK